MHRGTSEEPEFIQQAEDAMAWVEAVREQYSAVMVGQELLFRRLLRCLSPYVKLILWIISHSQVLSIVSILIPLLSISAMLAFYTVRPRVTLLPVVFSAIPLGLSCIPIQLIAESERILETFRGFSTRSNTGLLQILELLTKSRYALISRIIEVASLVVVAILIEWYQGKKRPITLRSNVNAPTIGWLFVGSIGVIAAITFTVNLCNDLVRLLSMIYVSEPKRRGGIVHRES